MKIASQALAIARITVGQGGPEDRARIIAWDRLSGMLSKLDSKTSVLLRFNAIVVAALAYLVVISASDPFANAGVAVRIIGKVIGHASLLASVVSCGLAFPVINVEWEFFGGRLDRKADGEPEFDDAALRRLGDLVVHRTRLYSWAWRLAVAAGAGFALLVGLAITH